MMLMFGTIAINTNSNNDYGCSIETKPVITPTTYFKGIYNNLRCTIKSWRVELVGPNKESSMELEYVLKNLQINV